MLCFDRKTRRQSDGPSEYLMAGFYVQTVDLIVHPSNIRSKSSLSVVCVQCLGQEVPLALNCCPDRV